MQPSSAVQHHSRIAERSTVRSHQIEESIIMKLVLSKVAKAIVSACAIQKTDVMVCNSAGQEIPYVMLFTMYGFV